MMSTYESTKKRIEQLLMQTVYDKNLDRRTSTSKSIQTLLDRLIDEVKRDEAKKTSEILDREKNRVRQEVMKEEARKILVDGVNTAITEVLNSLKIDSAIKRTVTLRLKSLSEENVANLVDLRLEYLVNVIKSHQKWESFFPTDRDVQKMCECLPQETKDKIGIRSAISRCKLMDVDIPVGLENLEKMRVDVREALSELNRWKHNQFVQISELEETAGPTIDEKLCEAGFMKYLRNPPDEQELIFYYIPVDDSCINEAEEVEESLTRNLMVMDSQIRDLRKTEKIRKAEEYRRAGMVRRPY